MNDPWLPFLRKVVSAVVFEKRGDAGGVVDVKVLLKPGLEQDQFDQWAALAVQIWDQLEARFGADAAEKVFEATLIELADDAGFAAIE